ncbi:MAG: phosphoribosylamine--glycine ligase, partial [Saprospiraceae bacterium]|nr:phosphoribosylamine--glycine ligase [Saprospiraceae bacterium]
IGLILVNGEPFVIEYNCRMGDPETEVVLPRISSDFLLLLKALPDQNLPAVNLVLDQRSAATVMLVSGGYPEAYEKGKKMTIPDPENDSLFFQAGTKKEGSEILTNGGRVLAITSFGNDFREAVQKSLKQAATVEFEGKYFRSDIGFDL